MWPVMEFLKLRGKIGKKLDNTHITLGVGQIQY